MKGFVKGWKILGLFVVLALVTIPIVASDASAQAKTITLRFAQFFPPGHPHSVLSEQWCKEIEKRTNGKVKWNHYAGGSVVPPTQAYDGIVGGVVDAGFVVLGWHTGKFPLSEVAAYPMGMPSGVVATKIANEYYEKFKPAELSEVKVCYLHSTGPGILHTKKPVNKLEDLKGMKIRAFGPLMKWTVDLGAVPIGMPMGDAYDALSKGVVDGVWAPYEAVATYKLGEVVKYHIENLASSHHGVQVVMMNKKTWNSLPADVQKIIDAVDAEWAPKQGKVWDDADQMGKDFAKQRGNTVIRLSAQEDARWLAAAQPVFDEYIADMKKRGLPGEEVVKFYRERVKYYTTKK